MKIFDHWTSWTQAKERLEGGLSEDALALLDQAYDFAANCHGRQTRPNGDPYVYHLLEVIEILVEGAGLVDKEILATGMLHDVVEDTSCSLNHIRSRFGTRIAEFVEWLTKPPQDGREAREEYFNQLQSAPQKAIVVKLADRLSNVQKLETHPRVEKQKTYYRETVEKILPLAAGLPWFDSQFQIWREKFDFLAQIS